MEKSHTQKVGKIGEDVACIYLKKNGHRIICRNYWRKWGEIDVVAEKGSKLHFIEVKAISRKYQEHSIKEEYRPEENVHPQKLKRLYRVIETYLLDAKEIREWQLDVISVYLDLQSRRARCLMIENIV